MTESNRKFAPHVYQGIDVWVAKFPAGKQKSALLMALRIVQDEYNYLTQDLMDEVASYLSLPAVAVYEVASFYSMYRLKPVGKYHIKVCNSISCKLCGSEDITKYIENKLAIKVGQTTEDGKFTLDFAECLAACCAAPALIINDKHYCDNITPEKIDELFANIDERFA